MGMLHIDCEDEREILGICDHSGHVKKDEIYVCWRVLEEKKTILYQTGLIQRGGSFM